MEFSSMRHGKKYKTRQYEKFPCKMDTKEFNIKLSMMQLDLFFHYFFSPNIPANVVLRSFIVSSPSRSSSPSPWSTKGSEQETTKTLHIIQIHTFPFSLRNGFCFPLFPSFLTVEDAFELSDTVLDSASESVTVDMKTSLIPLVVMH